MGAMGGAEELARLEKAEGAGGGERILVSVRLRPLNSKEFERNDLSEWECINNNTVLFKSNVLEKSQLPSAYTYDRVFGCESATRQVYEDGAKEVALSVVGGINSSIFAYGQTSSGKTYTMTGITEYSMEDIYDYIEKHTERDFVLKFSAMEIYNESVKDLLSPDSGPLRLLDDPEKGTVVEKLTEETLRDKNHLRELLSVCEAQRQIGETLLNEMSSRSHQILRLTIESSAREFLSKDNLSTLSASVNFVDLAGSERASQALTAGSRLKEGCHINRSLLTLGTVIRKLSKGRNGHIPYRDSKLTRILQNSLGGNARTAIICTMSPARSHIEQSRNTLLFASCAKEVSTNAQVNVVMSDKALVKHLQRELARLESELKYSGLISPSDTLKEKDSQIKKMEKEMKELMKQRNLAQSRLEDLLRVVGEDRPSTQWEEFNQFSVPRAPITCEDVFSVSDTSGVGYQIPDFDFTSFEGSHGSNNQREKCVQSYNTRDHAFSPSHSISSTMSVGMFPHLEVKSEDFDHCKEVRCIEVDGSYTSISDEFDLLLTEESDSLLPPILDKNGNEEQELETKGTLLPTTIDEIENEDLQAKTKGVLLPHLDDKSHGDYEPHTKESLVHPITDNKSHGDHEEKTKRSMDMVPEEKFQSARKAINNLAKPYPDESSPVSLLRDLPNSMCLVLSRSRSCRASLMVSSLDPWFQEVEENNSMLPNSMLPNSFLKDVSERTGGIRRRGFSDLNCGVETNSLSGEGCLASEISTPSEAYKEQNSRSSKEGSRSPSNSVEELKQMAQIQYQRQYCQHTDHQEEQTDKGGSEVEREVKNVGLDPMLNSSEAPSQWLLEFEAKQGEIIKLWHVCHVSLVHRTYFFLLFKGDPSDSIYLEVEHRRLSFLKSACCGGNRAIGDGQNTTLASSMKDIRREREMLRKQMLKRLSEEEREALYKQWGIALDSKQRRMQLARRVWTETHIEHVRESASLVAKLIGLPELEQPLKEMFGLNFAPQITNSGSFSRKHRVSSFI